MTATATKAIILQTVRASNIIEVSNAPTELPAGHTPSVGC
jgi:hypothetical protein